MSTLATGEPAAARPRRPSAGAGHGPAGPAGRGPDRRRPPRPGARSRHLRRLATDFVRAFLEVESGRRTRAQLHPILCPDLALRLADVWVRGGPPGRVIRTHGMQVAPDRYEAVALVRRGDRYGAVAVTLGRVGRAWKIVDAARPEDAATTSPPGVPGGPGLRSRGPLG